MTLIASSRCRFNTRYRGLSGIRNKATRNVPAGIISTQNIQRQASKPSSNGSVEPPAAVRFEALDRYEGPPLKDGQASLTVRIVLQPLETTLTDEQSEGYRRALVARLQENLSVEIRS